MSDSIEAARWRLHSVEIRSFRGVATDIKYDFSTKPGLLHGDNGVGKSTVAQSIQWTLYGKFPSEVLSNTGFKAFLAPVSAKSAAWFGRVTLESGKQTLILTRDYASKSFTLELDGSTYEGDEAEQQRDRILGLDMAGFVRTVLLQQSRIRGLLLDSPKERNEALDRLLGMDDIEAILSRLKPRDFTKEAEARRSRIVEDERNHTAREELLAQQKKDAETAARERKFVSKDFSSAGLKKAYAAVGERLQRLASKYEVEVAPISECTTVALAPGVAEQLTAGVRSIRTDSALQKRLTPITTSIAQHQSLAARLQSAFTERAKVHDDNANWVAEHGTRDALVAKRAAMLSALDDKRLALKAAGQLRQLLSDGKDLLDLNPTDHCPLCEQSVESAAALVSKLSSRLTALTSTEAAELQADVANAEAELGQLDLHLAKLGELEKALNDAEAAVNAVRTDIVEALGGAGIPETKVESRLAEATSALEKQRAELSRGAEAMEHDLSELEEAERRIREGLVPVLKKRDELAKLEDAWIETQKSHMKDAEAAHELEATADKLTVLRSALLDAKNELATTTLAQARPRANQLYQQLVRHPVFDSLTLATQPKANKLDYSFEVSSGGKEATAREARMVLSDGQVTATAIGLFFAFSDAETHNLDLLYIDDPTQNLDQPCKEAMAKVVTEIAKQRQVVVSTQDEDFVSFLESEGFFDLAVVHHLQKWDGNPTVKTKVAG